MKKNNNNSLEKINKKDENNMVYLEKSFERIEKVKIIANKLSNIIENTKSYVVIDRKKYVKVEGWETLGLLFDIPIFPVTKEIEVFNVNNEVIVKAKVELQNANGIIVGGGIGLCSLKEKGRESFAKASGMAQTRAISRAFRQSFAFIMTLAGYEPTPAEEMIADIADNEKDVPVQTQVQENKSKIYTTYMKLKEEKKLFEKIINIHNVKFWHELPENVLDEIEKSDIETLKSKYLKEE